MARFAINPTDTSSVELMAATSGKRPKFLCIGFSNDGANDVSLIFKSATTEKFRIHLARGAGDYFPVMPGASVFPSNWFVAGDAVNVCLSGTGSVRVFGDVVAD
jgi:hypothetical protein